MTTVLVMGVLGKTGRQVAAGLRRNADVVVRGTSRTPRGDTLVRLDWDDPATWPPALAGADAIYLLRPAIDAAGTIGAFLASAAQARRVVLLSEIDAGSRGEATWERQAEAAVEDSTLEWTILRPNWFMQNFSDPSFYLEAIRDAGELELPSGTGATSLVDTRDIGEVAAACLLDPGHAGRVYSLTGSEAFTWGQIARALADAAGHDVRHRNTSLSAYLTAAAARRASPAKLAYYNRVYSAVQEGRTAVVSPDVEAVTGHSPRSFADFLAENSQVWHR